MEKPENMQILQYFQNGRRYHGLWSHGHMKILSVFVIPWPNRYLASVNEMKFFYFNQNISGCYGFKFICFIKL